MKTNENINDNLIRIILIIAIIALIVLIGFSLTSCAEGGSDAGEGNASIPQAGKSVVAFKMKDLHAATVIPTYTLTWKTFLVKNGIDDIIKGKNWSIIEGFGENIVLAKGADATEIFNWSTGGSFPFGTDDHGSFKDHFKELFEKNKAVFNPPHVLRTAMVDYMKDVPLLGIYVLDKEILVEKGEKAAGYLAILVYIEKN